MGTLYKAGWTEVERQFSSKIMKASIFFLVLASASAKPQFEGLKNIFSALSGDDERQGVEEQAREQNVHETFQVHLWGQQGAGRGGDDSACPDQDEAACGRDGEQADVLLPQQETP